MHLTPRWRARRRASSSDPPRDGGRPASAEGERSHQAGPRRRRTPRADPASRPRPAPMQREPSRRRRRAAPRTGRRSPTRPAAGDPEVRRGASRHQSSPGDVARPARAASTSRTRAAQVGRGSGPQPRGRATRRPVPTTGAATGARQLRTVAALRPGGCRTGGIRQRTSGAARSRGACRDRRRAARSGRRSEERHAGRAEQRLDVAHQRRARPRPAARRPAAAPSRGCR